MNTNSIKEILNKYFDGESSIQEERQLKEYFSAGDIASELVEFAPLFGYYNSQAQINYPEKGADYYSALLDKYFDAETTVKEEQLLKIYFAGDDVHPDHQAFASLFDAQADIQSITYSKELSFDQLFDDLLEKYFEGETSLEEERTLKQYFSSEDVAEEHKQFGRLFGYFANAQTEKLEEDIEKEISTQARKGQLRVLRNRVMGIAASLAILLSIVFLMQDNFQSDQMALTDAERIEAEEALETTMEALAMLGVKFKKGQESLEKLSAIQKTQILK